MKVKYECSYCLLLLVLQHLWHCRLTLREQNFSTVKNPALQIIATRKMERERPIKNTVLWLQYLEFVCKLSHSV
jgi:hypothetical protein